jgi:ABC-type transporter Mla subunit MlaD
MPDSFTMKVSDRSLRRVQLTMTALQAADQTAKAAVETMQGVVAGARKSLDEALAAICDAHDQTLPTEYTVSLDQANLTVTISEGDATGATGVPSEPEPAEVLPVPANGVDHASAPPLPSGGTPT